jgi:hypothetical protein
MKERCDKARRVVCGMRDLGMNVTGWPPAAAAQVYISFIRPVMEYGVELKIPTPDLMITYQRTQNFALRTIFSAPANTCIHALHRVLAIPMFKFRAEELNFLSAARFHNCTDASIRGVDIWRRAVDPARGMVPGSLPRKTMALNPLAAEFRPQFLNHATNPLTRDNPVYLPPPIEKAVRRQRRVASLQELGRGKGGVAESVYVREDGTVHEYLTARTKVTREQRVSISRWQLGMVAGHQDCRRCGGEKALSREHAVDCAEAEELLEDVIPGPDDWGADDKTMIDAVINGAARGMDSETAEALTAAITRIEERCRGRERTEMGFYR